MPNWKKVIVSGSDAALNSLNVTSAFIANGINYPTSDGSNNQSLITDGAGNLTFGNPYSDNTVVYGKNLSGTTIEKGTPLYFTGSGTAGNLVGVFPADASNPARMPAGGIAGEQMLNGAEGVVLLDGFINGVDTSAFGSGDLVYVGVGGGYTNVVPTGSSNLIQPLGYVEKISDTNGSGVIKGPGVPRSVPNIHQGYVWVGNADDVPTPTATSSLSVASATQTSQAITFNNGGAGAASGTTFNGSTPRTISYNTIGAQPLLTNPVTGTGTTNYLPKFTGTSALGNSLVYDNGTNVGIGTTVPASKLEVYNGNASLRLSTYAATARYGFGNPARADDAAYIEYQGVGNFTGNLIFATNGVISNVAATEKMRITGVGNVGIGTVAPVGKLQIASSESDRIIISNSTVNYNVSSPKLSFFGYSNGLITGPSIQKISDGSYGSGRLAFFQHPGIDYTTETEVMSITSAGNVGIGTTSPSYKLDVSGSNATTLARISSPSSTYKFNANSTSGYTTSFNMDDVGLDIGHDSTSRALNLITGNTDRLTILGTGNVGIGTTSPGDKLEVSGNVYAAAFNSIGTLARYNGTGGIAIAGLAGNTYAYIKAYSNSGGTGKSLSIQPDGGNVGIGTTSPTSLLHVSGSTLINGPLTVQGSPTDLQYTLINNDLDITQGQAEVNNYGTYSRLRLFRASGTIASPTTPSPGTAVGRLEFGAYNSGTSTFIANAKIEASMDATTGADDLPSRLAFFTTPDGSTNMIERMRINNTGLIRIGGTTMNFSDVLNVEAGSIAFENGYGLRFTNTLGTPYASVYSSNNNTVIKSLGTAVLIKDISGANDIITALDGGDVGIGTTPTEKLHVSGSARIEGALYDSNNSAGTSGQVLSSTETGTDWVSLSEISGVDGTGTANYITKWSDGDSITDSVIFESGSNIGIGTVTPTQKLDVVGKIALNDGGNSVYIGTDAGVNDDASNNRNVGVGYQALLSNTTGYNNTANGHQALYSNTTGYNNTANGSYALFLNTTGNYNTANGPYALYSNTSGSYNTANGNKALLSNTTGYYNTANGSQALYKNTTGYYNTANGYQALYSNTTGVQNTANGYQALFSNTTGYYNTANGYQAGRYIADKSTAATIVNNSVLLGYRTSPLADDQTNQIVIGYDANGLGSNTAVLGNDSIVTTALKGNVGIGTTSPTQKLHVAGNGLFSGTVAASNLSGTNTGDLSSTKRVDLTSTVQTADYRRSVIALCEVTNTDVSLNSYSSGTIVTHRANALSNNTEQILICSFAKNYNSTVARYKMLKLGVAATNIRACTFTYNGVKYAGVELYLQAARSSKIEFNGATNFNIFGLDYYDTQNNLPLNTEVNNSLNFTENIADDALYYNEKTIYHAGNFLAGTHYQTPETTLSGYGITDAYTKTEIDSGLNIAYKNQANVFTANVQTILASSTPTILLSNSNDVANFSSRIKTAYSSWNAFQITQGSLEKNILASSYNGSIIQIGEANTKTSFGKTANSDLSSLTSTLNVLGTTNLVTSEVTPLKITRSTTSNMNTTIQFVQNLGSSYIGVNSSGDFAFNTTADLTIPKFKVSILGEATFASTIQATTAKLTNLTDGYIPYHKTDALGLENSNIFYNGTNVGIGTTAPGAKLDVEGDVLIKAANLSNQENTDVDTGTEVVATVAIATYTAAFFDFVIKNGTNVRSGTVFACHDGTNVEYTETSTTDLGNTADVTLSVDISAGNMRLLATTTTDNWSVKSLVRAL